MINEIAIKLFGLRIKQLRVEEGISQEALAHNTGFHRTYIGMLERGERNISLSHIAVFAKYFQLSLSQLLDFSSIASDSSFNDYTLKSE